MVNINSELAEGFVTDMTACDTPEGRVCQQPNNCQCPGEITEGLVTYQHTPPSTDECHRAMVKGLKKPPYQILASLTLEQVDAIHMMLGIAGEAGELVDAFKRWTMYQKPLDRENVTEELGDLEFYMEGIRQSVGITREETLRHNLNKLATGDKARYKNGYSDAAAIARVDKE